MIVLNELKIHEFHCKLNSRTISLIFLSLTQLLCSERTERKKAAYFAKRGHHFMLIYHGYALDSRGDAALRHMLIRY